MGSGSQQGSIHFSISDNCFSNKKNLQRFHEPSVLFSASRFRKRSVSGNKLSYVSHLCWKDTKFLVSLRRVLYTICSLVDEENSIAALQESSPTTTNEQPVFVKEPSLKYRLFCCQREGVSWAVTPLSVASGRKRYNTLDFASKVVCQQGAARPYWMTQSRWDLPLGLPFIFFAKRRLYCKNSFLRLAKKIQKHCNQYP